MALSMRLRRLAFIVIALALLLRGTGGLFAASPAPPHCPPIGHACCDLLRVTCCDDDSPAPMPVAPPVGSQTAPSPSSTIAQPSDAVSTAVLADRAAVLAWTPTPTHDLRRLDLSVFLSVFLI
jgi:hypothetical protein